MAAAKEETFTGVGDFNIFFRSWRPAGNARGVRGAWRRLG